MANIGSWWLASHQAQEGGKVIWSCFAAHAQSADRAMGGKLFVTNRPLLFLSTNLVDYATGGDRWSASLAGVCNADEQPAQGLEN